ncbi:hypothetical protein SAMN05421823_109148 [Catalinimonas alkaloidigena]|uniref:Ser/Thr protein kinase RdoA involved in Cpx stress response, MazF antagonist n=1 Tax=Catalinimonas alkaloidigena TaxID=1075417 RepID=A0A1G9PC74_9BACT|nr:hypothetical protein [Catalinimonas alkaloidigena]SDL96358.1 hypothetical protein SAMN05421823_109148 [Catalinimonas alkaloidigena]
MRIINYDPIIRRAWREYDSSRRVLSITDISAKVSTNHVFRVKLENDDMVIAKLSYFGRFEHFLEDHSLINALSTNLPEPYSNFLARSLTKHNQLYTYRHKDQFIDAWVVFYNPISVKERLPRIQPEENIRAMGRELAKFHKACFKIRNVLPGWSKTIKYDIYHLMEIIKTDLGRFEYRLHLDDIKHQCVLLLENMDRLKADSFPAIPVFVDWNIGNFSVDENLHFYSRWDYDWFRMSSRILDFYFFSRVCSTIGDRTVFSYLIDPLMEDRFMWFLEEYHQIYPLTRPEVLFMKEAYRFFILNYVIKDGRYFFHEIYASKLQLEAFNTYFPLIDLRFNPDKILSTLQL